MKLQVLKTDVTDDLIKVSADYKDRPAIFKVNKTDFEKFTDKSKSREWVMDSSNHLGEHIQISGKSDWPEIYEDRFRFEDLLIDFITSQKLKPVK
jgi:hypothetical protein